MKSGNRSNALLVELLIVVMFFMLSCTVLLQVFTTARGQSARAEMLTQALNAAQNAADRLYAADDPEKALRDMEFQEKDGEWVHAEGDWDLFVTALDTQALGDGTLSRFQVQAREKNGPLITLPVVRYGEVRP